MAGSEYGGDPGIIQPDSSRVSAEAAQAGYFHDSTAEGAADRRGVRDAAMVLRRAGLMAAHGVVAEGGFNPETGVYETVPYSEEKAREDYLNGDNGGPA